MRVNRLLLLILLAAACVRDGAFKPRSAPPFDLPDLAGGKLALAALNNKVVVLDFWATWCGPCVGEIPEYAEFWRKNRSRGVEVVGVIFDSGSPQEIADFIREYQIPYHQLLGNEHVQETYDAQVGYPTTFIIDRKGVIRSRILGSPPKKFEQLQQAVNGLLAES
jgi:peroxiredoxin